MKLTAKSIRDALKITDEEARHSYYYCDVREHMVNIVNCFADFKRGAPECQKCPLRKQALAAIYERQKLMKSLSDTVSVLPPTTVGSKKSDKKLST